jgi:hypothetical protein
VEFFGALSRAFSDLLTDEQQQAWIAAAVNVLSRLRLEQRGPLTGQQDSWPNPAGMVTGVNYGTAVSCGRYLYWS